MANNPDPSPDPTNQKWEKVDIGQTFESEHQDELETAFQALFKEFLKTQDEDVATMAEGDEDFQGILRSFFIRGATFAVEDIALHFMRENEKSRPPDSLPPLPIR